MLAGIVGLGAVALIVDRTLIGYDATGPGTAGAAVMSLPADVNSAARVIAVTDTSGTVIELNTEETETFSDMFYIAQRLEQVADSRKLKSVTPVDAFADFSQSRNLSKVDSPAPEKLPNTNHRTTVFANKHTLQAVMTNNNGSFVIIDGNMVHLSQEYDGFKLVEIDRRTAVFASGPDKVTLTLPGTTFER